MTVSVMKVVDLQKVDSSTKVAAIFLGLVGVFVYFVYPSFPTAIGKNLTSWIWEACNPKNGFLHGRFVPVAFLIMCWIGVKRAKNEEVRSSWVGVGLLLLGLLSYLVAVRTIQPRIALAGLPLVIIGVVYFLAGWKVARHFVFPAFFWWFAIPVPGLKDALTGNLQVLVTKSCYHVGKFVGMDLVNHGSNISVGGSDLSIAEGCSGIRSLMALAMIAAVYANYTQKTLWKKAVLFACALPLAILGNFFRIFTILVLTHFGFEEFARQTYHDWAGLLLFFPIALAGLFLCDYLLNWRTRRKKKVKRTRTRRSVVKT